MRVTEGVIFRSIQTVEPLGYFKPNLAFTKGVIS